MLVESVSQWKGEHQEPVGHAETFPARLQHPSCVHVQGRVAFLPCLPVTLKALKPKETDFEPRTIGEHIKRCRLRRKITQGELARLLEARPDTVLNWEKGHTEPPIELMPAILQFLGYDPFPEPNTLPERMLAKRRAMGWSIKEAARQLRVDEGTWGAWERGETILFRKHRVQLARFLGMAAAQINGEMRNRWIRSHQRARLQNT